MMNNASAGYFINGQWYSTEEVMAIHGFYQEILNQKIVKCALTEALAILRGSPDIVAFGRKHFQEIYEECLKSFPAWEGERESVLEDVRWAYRNQAAATVKEMYARKCERHDR